MKNIFKRIISIITLRTDPLDPVHHCNIHKQFGCSHVDGFLCNMRTCNITVTQHVTPMSTKAIKPEFWKDIDYQS